MEPTYTRPPLLGKTQSGGFLCDMAGVHCGPSCFGYQGGPQHPAHRAPGFWRLSALQLFPGPVQLVLPRLHAELGLADFFLFAFHAELGFFGF